MPESPDFDQIALTLAEGLHAPAEALDAITEQLRLVWNARGAADIAKLEHELSTRTGSTAAGPSIKSLDPALRTLDR
jgi:hypothetical protein